MPELILVIDYQHLIKFNRKGLAMKYAVLYLVVAVVLTGCASANKYYTQEGKEVYRIDCSGKHLSWDTCYETAGQTCTSKGYEFVGEKSEQSGGLLGTKRSMSIRCKE